MENWRDIPGYEGRYQVSDLGRVRSLPRIVERTYVRGCPPTPTKRTGKILSSGVKGCGHMNVSLGANNTYLVHRLVLLAFVGPAPKGCEARHLNGKPYDNKLSNLQWGTRLQNRADISAHAKLYHRRQGSSQLSEQTIRAIKRDLAKSLKQKDLAKKYGVHINTINNINREFTHKWVEPWSPGVTLKRAAVAIC